ncbi:MAG: complex I NDUFA9 subunit family protein [Hyphomicrobiaceae bacterium]|nr:complex I NDUFA9 subunit family protein [Hyphomicrobiaceae bacterium]
MAGNRKITHVAVFGGAGFLGAVIVRHLVSAGIKVRVCARKPGKRSGMEAVEPVYADIRDEGSLSAALEGCDAAVNAVGLYVEGGSDTFEAVHVRGAANLAHQCAAANISSFVHMSGIGIDPASSSPYVRARALGEQAVRAVFPETTILRPSVLFGPDDRFINTLAKIIRHAPVIPLFGSGRTKLQAVYVGDVAAAVAKALHTPVAAGRTYELGGPQSPAYRDIVELVMARIGKKRLLLPVPFALWKVVAAASSLLPAPPVTRDQIALMRKDNVVGKSAFSFSDLGIDPTPLESVLPDYAL